MATVPLPDYAITRIRTGQYIIMEDDFNHVWKGEFQVSE